MACCKSCAKHAKISGAMKKGKSGNLMATLTDIAMAAAGVTGGIIAANLLTNNTFVNSNKALKLALPVAGAVALPMFLGGNVFVKALSVGMATTTVLGVAQSVAPGLAPQISGGSSSWKSNFNPGISAGPIEAPRVIL